MSVDNNSYVNNILNKYSIRDVNRGFYKLFPSWKFDVKFLIENSKNKWLDSNCERLADYVSDIELSFIVDFNYDNIYLNGRNIDLYKNAVVNYFVVKFNVDEEGFVYKFVLEYLEEVFDFKFFMFKKSNININTIVCINDNWEIKMDNCYIMMTDVKMILGYLKDDYLDVLSLKFGVRGDIYIKNKNRK